MKYLLDSDELISYFNKWPETTKRVNTMLLSFEVAISTISITEIRAGWTKEIAAERMPRLYSLLSVYNVTTDIAEQAGVWRQSYKTKGIQLSTQDTIIAATAYLNDYCLVTNNTKDYPMPELNLYRDKE